MHGNIDFKGQFDINEFRQLKYNKATVDPIFLQKYIDIGHSKEQMVIYNYFEPNKMPNVVSLIKNYFTFLSPLSVAINYIKPGQYLPLHSDLYKKWTSVNGIKDPNEIQRYIVMLEDRVPGQILEIGNKTISQWKQGDYFGWQGPEQHAVYNFSNKDRFAVQVTGKC